MMLGSASAIAGFWWLLRRPQTRAAIVNGISQVPGISGIFQFYRTSLFCRILACCSAAASISTATLRIRSTSWG